MGNGNGWRGEGLHPTLRDEAAKDGAPERFGFGERRRQRKGLFRSEAATLREQT